MAHCYRHKLSILAIVTLFAIASSGVKAQGEGQIPQIILEPLAEADSVPQPAPISSQLPAVDNEEPQASFALPEEAVQEYDGESSMQQAPPEVTDAKINIIQIPEAIETQEEPPQETQNIIDLDQQLQPAPPSSDQGDGISVSDSGISLSDFEKAAEVIANENPEDDVFYDPDALVPTSQQTIRTIRKVNPRVEPGSRFVIVNKDAKIDTVEAQLVAASRALKLGRYQSALDLYDSAYKANKKDPNVLMGRAVALQHLDRFDEAMQAYEAFSDLDADNVEARVNMLGLLATKFPAVAQNRLEELYDEKPTHVGVLAQLAMTLGKQGDFQGAMRYLGIAASLQPKSANHVYNMAVVADRAGDHKSATQFYEKALDLDTTYGRGQSIPRDAIYDRLAAIR